MSIKIAFQGELGAYSHQACLQYDPGYQCVPCQSFEDAIGFVKDKTCDFAMIPVENSIYGRVADVHRLLPESGLFIVAEEFIRINIHLLGLPESRLEHIEEAAGHPVILPQCSVFLQERGITPVPKVDNAKAALDVSQSRDPTKAALASQLAADIYGLKVLAEGVENTKNNTTRFLVMSREMLTHSNPIQSAPGQLITSFVFRTKNIPAALYKALGGFATNGVNMIKIESYMADATFTATQFYVEIHGQVSDPNVQLALEEVEYFTSYLKILGTYSSKQDR